MDTPNIVLELAKKLWPPGLVFGFTLIPTLNVMLLFCQLGVAGIAIVFGYYQVQKIRIEIAEKRRALSESLDEEN